MTTTTNLLKKFLHATVWQAETPQCPTIWHRTPTACFFIPKNIVMIAKINLDGKDHLAVVFDETTSYDDLQGIKNALLSCLTNALMKECYMTEDDKFYFLSLVQELELKEQQAFSMFKKYFNDNVEKQEMPIKKTCDIYV